MSNWRVREESNESAGKVLVGIWYENTTLYVRVVKAKYPTKANAYTRVKLIPDHGNPEGRTKIKKKTCTPKFKETLKVVMFYICH